MYLSRPIGLDSNLVYQSCSGRVSIWLCQGSRALKRRTTNPFLASRQHFIALVGHSNITARSHNRYYLPRLQLTVSPITKLRLFAINETVILNYYGCNTDSHSLGKWPFINILQRCFAQIG